MVVLVGWDEGCCGGDDGQNWVADVHVLWFTILISCDVGVFRNFRAFLPSSLLLSYLLSLSATSPGLVALSHFEMRMSGGVVGDAVDESRTWKCG
ncbi:hypothetical protein LR48_Vigan06g065300 [Vigna angularis]|uniref:Uncharacterized protein n=1 Tax=Phaseolus angularis TaxID=3914 RepID=A0A0L9URW9_PHAAN|nr:hypothetical protein LR48_Vigan06g065300 [Vigna angularis]